tara:strand:+ start:483 stop:1262 length:780 start_codon:yes stop_codon:yes gene_type:complete
MERQASDIECFYWTITQLRQGKTLSIRVISRACKISRHKARKILEESQKLIGQESASERPVNVQQSARSKGPVRLSIVETDQQSASNQPVNGQESDNIILKSKSKSKDIINYTKKPLGKRCKPELVTKRVGEVWNHWYSFNEKTRTVNGECARVIRTALKNNYTVDELKLIVSWAMESEDYKWQRENGYQYCKNFMNLEKIDGNHEKAQDWSESVNAPNQDDNRSFIDKAYDALSDWRYGPNGYLLPKYGGEYRPAGDY